jgi:trehalose synthase
MARLLGDPLLRKSMGRRAKERVRRHFLMTRLLEDWLDLMASLLPSRRQRVTQEPLQSDWR